MLGKLNDVASGAANAVQDSLGKISDATKEVVETAADKVSGAVVPGKKQFDEVSDNLSNCAGPVKDLKGKLEGGVPGDAEAAMKAYKDAADQFTQSLTKEVDGDGKSLVPGSAMCFASCWISSVKTKLKNFIGEINAVADKAKGVPVSVMAQINGVTKQADIFIDSLERIAACPKSAGDKVMSAMTDPARLLKIPEELENEFNGLLATVKKELDALKSKRIGAENFLVIEVKRLVGEVEQFGVRVPNKLSSAFKPPAIACCCGGKGQALDTLTQSAESISGAKFEAMLNAAGEMWNQLIKFDDTPISTTLNEIEGKFKDATKTVKEAADKLNNSAVGAGLRKVAGEGEGQPAPPDAAPGAVPEEAS